MAELSLLLLQQTLICSENGRRAGTGTGRGRGGGGGGRDGRRAAAPQLLRCGNRASLLPSPPPPSPLPLARLGLDPNQTLSETRSFPHHRQPSHPFSPPEMLPPDLIFFFELDHAGPQPFLAMAARLEQDASKTSQVAERNARRRQKKQESEECDDFYANLGSAIRTLREETPHVFYKDLTYDIYREDITFRDRRNTFTGIGNYKLMFWSLRFHARMFFKTIWVEVRRIWQPSDRVIIVRWAVRGIPRVPWNAQGLFEGTSEYKLDKNGKIYEHKVDNIARNQPPFLRTPDVLRLLSPAPCATPTPTFFEGLPSQTWMVYPYAMHMKCIRISLDVDRCDRALAVCLLVPSQLL